MDLMTRNDAKGHDATCGYAEGVDGINMHTPPQVTPLHFKHAGECVGYVDDIHGLPAATQSLPTQQRTSSANLRDPPARNCARLERSRRSRRSRWTRTICTAAWAKSSTPVTRSRR